MPSPLFFRTILRDVGLVLTHDDSGLTLAWQGDITSYPGQAEALYVAFARAFARVLGLPMWRELAMPALECENLGDCEEAGDTLYVSSEPGARLISRGKNIHAFSCIISSSCSGQARSEELDHILRSFRMYDLSESHVALFDEVARDVAMRWCYAPDDGNDEPMGVQRVSDGLFRSSDGDRPYWFSGRLKSMVNVLRLDPVQCGLDPSLLRRRIALVKVEDCDCGGSARMTPIAVRKAVVPNGGFHPDVSALLWMDMPVSDLVLALGDCNGALKRVSLTDLDGVRHARNDACLDRIRRTIKKRIINSIKDSRLSPLKSLLGMMVHYSGGHSHAAAYLLRHIVVDYLVFVYDEDLYVFPKEHTF